MEQFENVIKALQLTKSNPVEGWDYRGEGFDGAMVHTSTALIDAALAMIWQQRERIKELEAGRAARVMTLEELEAIYQKKDTHVWPFTTPPYLWMTVNPDVRLTRGFWICWRDIMYSLENGSPFYVRENYGKVWKIWTAEPTDEQREETQWY